MKKRLKIVHNAAEVPAFKTLEEESDFWGAHTMSEALFEASKRNFDKAELDIFAKLERQKKKPIASKLVTR